MQNITQTPYQQKRHIGYGAMDNVVPLRQQIGKSFAEQNFIAANVHLNDIHEENPLLLYQKRTALFMRRSFPYFSSSLSNEYLEKLALIVQKYAAQQNITTEKQIWNYMIILVYCGFFFMEDVQYNGILRLIGWHEHYSDKELLLDRLLDVIEDYAQECAKDYACFDKKLKYLAGFYMEPQFSAVLLQNLPASKCYALAGDLLGIIFPVRGGLWTQENRQKIIMLGLDHAQNMGFTVKDGLFYVLASIYFGRSFEQSPFYPWAYFLCDRRLPVAERAKRFISVLQQHFIQLAGG